MTINNWCSSFLVDDDFSFIKEGQDYPFVRFSLNEDFLLAGKEITNSANTECAKHFRCSFFVRAFQNQNSDDGDQNCGVSFSFAARFALPYEGGKIIHHEIKLTVLQDETGSYFSDAVNKSANSEFASGIFSAFGSIGSGKTFIGKINNENVRVPFCPNRWYFICAFVDIDDIDKSTDTRLYINGVPISLQAPIDSKLDWEDSATSVYVPYNIKSYIDDLVVDVANFWTYASSEDLELEDKEFIWKFANQANGNILDIPNDGSVDGINPIAYFGNKDGNFKLNSVTTNEIVFQGSSVDDNIEIIETESVCYRTSLINSYVKFLFRNNADSFTRFLGSKEVNNKKIMFSCFVNFDENFTNSSMIFSNGETNNYHEIHLRSEYSTGNSSQIWWSGQQSGSSSLRRQIVKNDVTLQKNKWNFISGYIDFDNRSNCWFAVNDFYDEGGLLNDTSANSSKKFEGLLCFGASPNKSYKIAHLYFFTDSIISEHSEINWTDSSLRFSFVANNKPKYGGIDGSEILGFKPYAYIDPSIGIGVLSEAATCNSCDLQTSKSDSAAFNKINSYSIEDEVEIIF